MDLSNFSILKEDDTNYHVAHPKGKTLVVAKGDLSAKAKEYIERMKKSTQHFDEGGKIPEALDPNYVAPEEPSVVPQTPAAAPAISPPPPPEVPNNNDAKIPQPADQSAEAMIDNKKDAAVTALEQQKAGVSGVAAAKAQESAAGVKAIEENEKEIAKLPTQMDIMNKYKTQDDALLKAYRDQKIDPDRYMKNMSVPAKIGSAIGMILSGFGSGLAGQPNIALEMMKKSIDNDIEAQKGDKESKMNLWKMNHQAMGDEQAATLATQNQMYTAVKYKLEKAALQAGTPMAMAQAKISNAQIDQQIAENNYQRSLISIGLGKGTPGGQYSGQDPSILVPQLIKDPGAQAKALEEIKNATNVSNNGDKIMASFDKAAKENTVLSTGAGLLRTPGSVMALHQLMLPNFKSIDGTVRQAAMDESFHNLTPAAGDTDAKIAEKRQALQDWLHSESAAPTAKAHGIDLSKFSNTAVRESAADARVRAFMRDNPGVSSEQQAIQILKNHGKF